MPRRFTMQEKWDDPWFRKLSPAQKCFWEYIHNRCSYAGIWQCDFETAEHYIDAKLNVEEIKATFEGKYLELEDGKKWFLLDYLDIQHKGGLNPNDRSQKNVYKELIGLGLLNQDGTLKHLQSSIKGTKKKDIDIEKDTIKNKESAQNAKEEINEVIKNKIKKIEEDSIKKSNPIWDEFTNCFIDEIQDGVIETDMTEEFI